MIYLNYAALSPPRLEVQQEVESTLAAFTSLLYSREGLDWYQKKISSCRQGLAEWLNVGDPSSIVFVPNASMASHLALSFIDWQPGDVILTSTHENPSVIREIDWLVSQSVQVNAIKPMAPDDFLATIQQHLGEKRIKAILLSHVSHVDGRIFPVREIGRMAKEYGIIFIVDGAQAIGHIPVNFCQLNADLYFFPGHKWCQGPLGTGAMIMQESFMSKNPAFSQAGLGWNGTAAGRFEIGTQNISLIAGLAKACNLLKKEGLNTKALEDIGQRARKEISGFDQLSFKHWSGHHAPGILTIHCRDPRSHTTLMELLQDQLKIVVKSFLDYPKDEIPAIRLSWAGWKDQENVSLAVSSIREKLIEH